MTTGAHPERGGHLFYASSPIRPAFEIREGIFRPMVRVGRPALKPRFAWHFLRVHRCTAVGSPLTIGVNSIVEMAFSRVGLLRGRTQPVGLPVLEELAL